MEPQLPKPQIPSILRPVDVAVPATSRVQERVSPTKIETEQFTQHGVPTANTSLTPSVVPVQQTALNSVAQQPAQGSSTTNPSVAADDDVIEKEWVDKAKQVVNNTNGDPRLQKHNVSLLQADYINKRYGKELKLPRD